MCIRDSCLNNDEETEEERRLMYVALTRARNYLSVTYPLNAYSSRRGADYSLDQLCRFIDRGVRDNMQRVALGTDNAPAVTEETCLLYTSDAADDLTRVDLGGRRIIK